MHYHVESDLRTEALIRAVEERRTELAEFAQSLVRVPTVNPPGENYLECARMLGERLRKSGFDIEYLRAEGTPGDSDRHPRWNVVARREGNLAGPTVHFNSHLDVVPAGTGWSEDPFAGRMEGDRIYGRGACDMKGGLAASVLAVEAFLATHSRYPGAIEVSGTADEETGGYGGAAWLAERGILAAPRVDYAIIPEPLGNSRICLGHRGCVWVEIGTRGRIAHGCMPDLGECAVRHMGAVLRALETRLFPNLLSRIAPHPVIPPQARRSSMNINAVHGGQPDGTEGFLASCVPDECRLTIDRRFHDPETVESVLEELLAIVRETAEEQDFQWEWKKLWAIPPVRTPDASPLVSALDAAIPRVLGRNAEHVLSPGTYDHKHFDRIGKVRHCVAYGPGILEMAHQPDEYIEVGDMAAAAAVMAVSLENLLCGPPQRTPQTATEHYEEPS